MSDDSFHLDRPNFSDETMMTIHFNANLRPIVGERVGMLHWIMDPEASGFIIAYDLSGDSVLISNFDVSCTRENITSWAEMSTTASAKSSRELESRVVSKSRDECIGSRDPFSDP